MREDWSARLLRTANTAVSRLVLLRLRRCARRSVGIGRGVFFGTTPIITLRDFAEAAREHGEQASSVVREVLHIHHREDFDVLTTDLLGGWARRLPGSVREILAKYATFAWALSRFDVFWFLFDGRILVGTPLERHEFDLLRAAGKKTIVMGYGADVQLLDRMSPDFAERLLVDYPATPTHQAAVARRLDDAQAGADVIVGGVEWVDYLRRVDLVVAAPFYIAADLWRRPDSTLRSTPGPVRVLHAPNHRSLKGTDLLIAAVETLKREGLPLELVLLERVPNEEVRHALATCDLLAEQFIVGWHGLLAVEAMSMGVAVLAHLRDDLLERYRVESFASECPIVPTTAAQLVDHLRELCTDEPRRRDLGAQGRAYVERWHSRAAAGKLVMTAVALARDEIDLDAARARLRVPAASVGRGDPSV